MQYLQSQFLYNTQGWNAYLYTFGFHTISRVDEVNAESKGVLQ